MIPVYHEQILGPHCDETLDDKVGFKMKYKMNGSPKVMNILAHPFGIRGHEAFELFISKLSILRARDLEGDACRRQVWRHLLRPTNLQNECFHDIDLV
jgi:hypothetical protein